MSDFVEASFPDGFKVPDTIASIENLEGQESAVAFQALREQFIYLESLSPDDGRHRSFHKIFGLPDGDRSIYFTVTGRPGIGRIQRIIVNDEHHKGQRTIANIREFMVPRAYNEIICEESRVVYDIGDESWRHEKGTGPFLWVSGEVLDAFTAQNYRMPEVPRVRHMPIDLLSMIRRRSEAQSLVKILAMLSSSTMEPGILLAGE